MPIDPGSFYCAVCDNKVLFSEFIRDRQGDIKLLCNDCAKTHELRVEPIDPSSADQQEA